MSPDFPRSSDVAMDTSDLDEMFEDVGIEATTTTPLPEVKSNTTVIDEKVGTTDRHGLSFSLQMKNSVLLFNRVFIME